VAIARTGPLARRSSAEFAAVRNLIVDRSRQLGEAAGAGLRGRWADLTVRVAEGDPHEQLLRAAAEWKADLVVVGDSLSAGFQNNSLHQRQQPNGYAKLIANN
jgi:nucleotide-binding universal stress UspA family protein